VRVPLTALAVVLAACSLGGCPSADGLFGLGGHDYSGIYSGNVTTTVSTVPAVSAPVTQSNFVSIAVDRDGNQLFGDKALAVGDKVQNGAGPFAFVYTVQSVNVSDTSVYVVYSIAATIAGSTGSGTGSMTLRYSGSNALEYRETGSFGDASIVIKVDKLGTLTK